ncbi:WS/DGAT/MGAT family O-acyltransferase [Congregibacter sp.]|uniref:WS/DGAT/MGAT family O-acyltransferase n=1 Tax=Congregibacter sp. TaxID=2744308 RepID=UPI003F6B48AE
MRRIDLASAGFLLLEKRETPMHVGGINLFTLPEGVDEQAFMASLLTQLRESTDFRKPFGEYVVTSKTGLYWEKDSHIDMDYHVRHSALPSPGRYRELFALASRFHTTLLDRTRPLWEMHIIEGLQDRQFAVYNKIHHAAIDGVGAMQITQAMCTEEADGPPGYAPFSLEAYNAYKKSRFGDAPKPSAPDKRDMRNVMEALKQQYDSSINLATAMRRFGLAFVGRSGNLAVPWHNVPKTSINTRVSGARRFVAQTFAFERVKNVCKSMDATVNDVVLAMCAGALRRYLLSRDELPLHSLKAMAPVSLREEGDVDSSNAIGFITADMATNVYDPEKRLRTIQESMRAGKDLLRELSPAEAALFMQLTQLPALLTSILGLGSKFPAFSTVVSNVPGPRKPLYWNGARLDGIYPASIVFDGFAMNITLVSYHNQLDFGIVACRRSLPQIQRIIDHLEDSLAELEIVAGVSGAGRRSTDNRRTAADPEKGKMKSTAKPRSRTAPKAKTKTKNENENENQGKNKERCKTQSQTRRAQSCR